MSVRAHLLLHLFTILLLDYSHEIKIMVTCFWVEIVITLMNREL